MKKVLTFVLVTALVMSMAMSASAVGSAEAKPEDMTPEVLTSTDAGLIVTPSIDVEELPEEAQEEFNEAVTQLPDAIAENQLVQSVAYVTLSDGNSSCTATFQTKNYYEPAVMQYIDGEWVVKQTSINADGSITVENLEEGTAAFVLELVPVTISASCNASAEADLPRELQKVVAEAREQLFGMMPVGMLIRHYFYADMLDDTKGSDAVFEMRAFNNLIVKQFVNGKWIELKYTVSENGTITVEGVVDGPMAILVN